MDLSNFGTFSTTFEGRSTTFEGRRETGNGGAFTLKSAAIFIFC
jgi:hypothetical protein